MNANFDFVTSKFVRQVYIMPVIRKQKNVLTHVITPNLESYEWHGLVYQGALMLDQSKFRHE
jgi:hypothetical protein